jgi:trans-2,3-dihydro-3-hydroxyanthranilate isomerase
LARGFFTLDVFTDAALAGNPLAVVLDAEGLDDDRMQAIAREFNLSETVFVFSPKNSVNAAAARIFTPARELPFAGHPTVGAAALLAHIRSAERSTALTVGIVLEEKVGDIACRVRRDAEGALAAEFDLPKPPERLQADPPPVAEIAAGLGLATSDIGFDGHRPSLFSAGAPYLFIPVNSLAAIRRAGPGPFAWAHKDGPAAFLYTRGGERSGSAFHARMFAANWGVVEDPATGSAAAAFAGLALAFDHLGDGKHSLTIEQGFEMGRPSLMALTFEVEQGALRTVSIGGSAVIVSRGALEL